MSWKGGTRVAQELWDAATPFMNEDARRKFAYKLQEIIRDEDGDVYECDFYNTYFLDEVRVMYEDQDKRQCTSVVYLDVIENDFALRDIRDELPKGANILNINISLRQEPE